MNLRLVHAITAVVTKDWTILVQINYAALSEYNSIISTNHVRAFGHLVDDVPRRFWGTQTISLKYGTSKVHQVIPLNFYGGLVWMNIRRPTQQELNEVEVYDLTDEPWSLGDDNDDDYQDYDV